MSACATASVSSESLHSTSVRAPAFVRSSSPGIRKEARLIRLHGADQIAWTAREPKMNEVHHKEGKSFSSCSTSKKGEVGWPACTCMQHADQEREQSEQKAKDAFTSRNDKSSHVIAGDTAAAPT
eukprot:scaffold75304_cov18-Tisochrysis_lutea.AAC.1